MTRALAVLATALLAGCADRADTTLGSAFTGPPVSIAEARRTNVNAFVVLRGRMVEKCPVAGCWFILRDASGVIKVDTKNAGFAVVDVPLGLTLMVAGRVVTNGTERAMDAAGVRY